MQNGATYRAQPRAAVLVLVIGGFEKSEESITITSTASLGTSTSAMDNVSFRGRLTVPNVHAIALMDSACRLAFFR